MCPIYLDIAAPVTASRRMPTMLWFAHPSVTPELRLAERLSDVVLTSLPGAYPRPSKKVRVVGQATDTERIAFDPRVQRDPGPLRLVAIGRTSPSKGFDRAIRALAKARAEGVEATLQIVGPSTTDQERAHAAELRDLAAATGLGQEVSLEPGVTPTQVDRIVRSADVLVNAMVSGSGDKVVFEAMAAGTLPLVANPAFRPLLSDLPLDLTFDRDDEAMLAGRIVTLAAADPIEMDRTRRTLRERVEAHHSLRGWAERVTEIAEGLR
jgi:glycosyltransferase involved in cell wall biosynthesis